MKEKFFLFIKRLCFGHYPEQALRQLLAEFPELGRGHDIEIYDPAVPALDPAKAVDQVGQE